MRSFVTIGADPELFLQNSKTGAFVSAHTYIQGTKDQPLGVPNGAVQVDGVAAEFNIDPADDRDKFIGNVQSVIATLHQMVTAQNTDLILTAAPTAHFTRDYFKSLPDSVKQLGCTPDYDAWNHGEATPTPNAERMFRTGGGHVHVGWTDGADSGSPQHFHDCIQMAKQLDVALYLPSLLFDSDRERQALYGKPGCFRPKSYGGEYRTLSNRWVAEPELVGWVFDATTEAMNMMLDERFTDNYLFELPPFRDALGKALSLSRKELLDIHHDIVNWGFPPLPEKYLEA